MQNISHSRNFYSRFSRFLFSSFLSVFSFPFRFPFRFSFLFPFFSFFTRWLQRPIRGLRESHARGAGVSAEFGVGPATQTRFQPLSRITRASSAPPNHSRSFPAHAISSPKPPEAESTAARIQMSSRSLHAELKPSRNKRAQSRGDTWQRLRI